MAARNLYPHPPCPKCGKDESLVKNTFYAPSGTIVRYRECKLCGKRFYSVQAVEEVLDTTKYKVLLGNWRAVSRQIKIVKVGTNQPVDL